MLPVILFVCVCGDLSFLSIGDWGGQDKAPYYTEGQKASADVGMPLQAAQLDAKFVLALGDNFYHSGIHGDETDARFHQTFEDVYSSRPLQIPFYVVAGNHDHMHNVTAQIFYSNYSSRWTFPDYYYTFTKTFNTTGGKRTAQFIMMDTVVLAGQSYHDEENDVFVKAEGPLDEIAANQQYAWLKHTLKQSAADYIWVGGHYPVWSVCNHGPTAQLVKDVKPLLEKHGVTGYIAGHDHCMSFIQESKDGPTYPLAGSTHECCYPAYNLHKNPEGSVKFYVAKKNANGMKSGFASFTMGADYATIRMHDENGVTLFKSTKSARKVKLSKNKIEH